MDRLPYSLLIGVLTLSTVASGAWYWPPQEVAIIPDNPTPTDEIAVILAGLWPDSCTPTDLLVTRRERSIYLDLLLEYDRYTGCADVITEWRHDASLGRLDPGDYAVYARIAENPMVPATNYEVLTKFAVSSTGHTTFYQFLPDQSTVLQTGGFAGVHETYNVEGAFGLRVNYDLGVAAFVEVDAVVKPDPFLQNASLGALFNMESLKATSVTEKGIRFEGRARENEDVVIEVAFTDDGAALTGTIRPGCCDFFNYDLNAVALPLEAPVCRSQPEMDFTGDCRVNLADLAIFLQSWLECNWYPKSTCWQ